MDYPQPQQHSQVVSPFVVGLYETFMHPQGTDNDGCQYLSVVQWYPETLQSYIDDRIASGEGFEMTMPIIRSLIECVEWIHSRKICHLNLKPSNFVRDPYMASSVDRARGTGWKLVDFEAARVIDEEPVGRCTISYAAPEILVGLTSSIGVHTKGALDIWSLGLVIFELLTDQPLFRTDD
ncbi:kinase-like domain-containing protein, partial [Dissophora ornata]